MKRHSAARAALVFAFVASTAGISAHSEEAVLLTPQNIVFSPVDPKDPMAGEVAVLAGDPSKPGPYALRARLKAGSSVKTHSHSTAEYGTVLSGKARMSFGDKPDEANAKTITAGSFLALPAGRTHTLWIDEDSVVDIYSTGPYDEIFVPN